MGDCMNKIGAIIVNRCIKLIIMMIPSFLWLSIIMIDVSFGISYKMYIILTNINIVLLIFTMLFLNAFLKITFPEDSFEKMEYTFMKPSIKDMLYGLITGLPLVLILFLMPYWLFILYGAIQLCYIIIDKDHLSMMERIYAEVIKIINSKHKKKVSVV